MTIDLYGMPLSTRVNKVRLIAHFLGLDYNFKQVKLLEGEHKQEPFASLSPTGKIPTLVDGEVKLGESNTIIRYLSKKYGKDQLYSNTLEEQAKIEMWMDYITIHLEEPINRILFNKFVAPRVGVNPSERAIKEATFDIEAMLPKLEKQLEETPFIAGDDMTLADIVLLAVLDPLEILEVDIGDFPILNKWQEHLKQKDFYQDMHESYSKAVESYMG